MPLGTSRCGENFISALSTLIKESEPAVGGGGVTEHEKEEQINVFVLCPGYFDRPYLSITMFPKSVQRLRCIMNVKYLSRCQHKPLMSLIGPTRHSLRWHS